MHIEALDNAGHRKAIQREDGASMFRFDARAGALPRPQKAYFRETVLTATVLIPGCRCNALNRCKNALVPKFDEVDRFLLI